MAESDGTLSQWIEKAGRGDGHNIMLAVRVTPKASKNSIGGLVTMADGRVVLAVRIAAPPVDGEANTTFVSYLSKCLKIPKADVVVASGATSRIKTVELRGAKDQILRRLEQLIGRN